jgi:hypothetical protein
LQLQHNSYGNSLNHPINSKEAIVVKTTAIVEDHVIGLNDEV